MKKEPIIFILATLLLSSCLGENNQSTYFSSDDYSNPGTQTLVPDTSEETSDNTRSSASNSTTKSESSIFSSSISSIEPEDLTMKPIAFPKARTLSSSELATYIGSDIQNDDGWVNVAHDDGLIVSPYHRVKHNGAYAPVYATRTTYGAHSFALFEGGIDEFPLVVSISSRENSSFKNAKVLPNENVSQAVSSGAITLTISKPGNYTVIPDSNYEKPITIFAYEKTQFIQPDGYSTIELEPGDHGELIISTQKTTLVFKKGLHRVGRLELNSNCLVYFESGAQLEAQNPTIESETPILNPDWAGMLRYKAFINGYALNNVKIHGHGYIDLSKLDWHARLGMYLEKCINIDLDGFIMSNSPEWTLEFMACSQGKINECGIFGYRQNSDGYAICDSDHIEVTSCFARSGDDLFEVKTMDGNLNNNVGNITFSSCVGWPDKCRGFGIIHETQRNITTVKYEDITVISAPADWMDALGALVVIVAGNAKISDVVFENVNINSCSFYPINVTLSSSSTSGVIDNITFKNISIPNSNKIRLLNESSGSVGNIHFSSIRRNGTLVSNTLALGLNKSGSIGNITLE